MDEYIKKDDLLKEIESTAMWSRPYGELYEAVQDMLAADVAPVRHGRWIEPQRLYYGAKQYECSLCYSDIFWKKHSITDKYPHCPNCGCRMDRGAGE